MLLGLQKFFDQIQGKNYIINVYINNRGVFVHQTHLSIFEILLV